MECRGRGSLSNTIRIKLESHRSQVPYRRSHFRPSNDIALPYSNNVHVETNPADWTLQGISVLCIASSLPFWLEDLGQSANVCASFLSMRILRVFLSYHHTVRRLLPHERMFLLLCPLRHLKMDQNIVRRNESFSHAIAAPGQFL